MDWLDKIVGCAHLHGIHRQRGICYLGHHHKGSPYPILVQFFKNLGAMSVGKQQVTDDGIVLVCSYHLQGFADLLGTF